MAQASSRSNLADPKKLSTAVSWTHIESFESRYTMPQARAEGFAEAGEADTQTSPHVELFTSSAK